MVDEVEGTLRYYLLKSVGVNDETPIYLLRLIESPYREVGGPTCKGAYLHVNA